MNTAGIIIVCASVLTGINIYCTAKNILNYKDQKNWRETIEHRRILKENQKRRMCNQYCKYKEQLDDEEAEWKCANCPIAEL